MKIIKNKGFTLAEVLITLAIIGVVAAILFPSILANYNERTLKAKRQALFGRMSQAMGEMADTFKNYAEVTPANCVSNLATCTDNGSAAKFVNEGLSKVYKIAAVCDSDSLSACDIPEEIKREDGTTFSLRDHGTSFTALNPQITAGDNTILPYDTNSVAFMTKNGESILLFYNPNCVGKSNQVNTTIYTETFICANMIYDLNGAKKKPNKIGQDIGYMSVFYSDSPYVVSPKPYDWRGVPDYETTINSSGDEVIFSSNTNQTYEDAKLACEALGNDVGLPNKEEGMAMQVNRELWAPSSEQVSPNGTEDGTYFWTSTLATNGWAWKIFLDNPLRTERHLYQVASQYSTKGFARCVYKD